MVYTLEVNTDTSRIELLKLMVKIELDLINRALEEKKGNKTHAAKLLGCNRTTLVEKMRKYGFQLNPRRPRRIKS
jgi:DNA-binding NtrC family response regulator